VIQTKSKDLLHVSIEPITRWKVKKVKKEFNGLIQDIWALFLTWLADSTYFSTDTQIRFILYNTQFYANMHNFQSNR
jgi:hypothetical protein